MCVCVCVCLFVCVCVGTSLSKRLQHPQPWPARAADVALLPRAITAHDAEGNAHAMLCSCFPVVSVVPLYRVRMRRAAG